MARLKNALRVHEIGIFKHDTPTAEPAEWLKLAKYIEAVNDESDEDTDDTGYYDGDGTPEETVLSVVGGFSFEGLYDAEDKAQALIASIFQSTHPCGVRRYIWSCWILQAYFNPRTHVGCDKSKIKLKYL